jgi:hypothetical protein
MGGEGVEEKQSCDQGTVAGATRVEVMPVMEGGLLEEEMKDGVVERPLL